MDFWRTIVVLFRRWYITVPAFIGTLALAAAAYSAVPIPYQSGSILVLTTPLTGGTESTSPDDPNPVTNPLMDFDRSLALAASVIIQELRSSETATALGITPGGTTTYVVNNGSSNPELLESGPFIFITGTAANAKDAEAITTRVAAMATQILAARQEQLNAPASTHIEMQVVVAPTKGQPLTSSPLRAAAGVGGLAALATLVAVYGFENLMTHRRRRRARKQREPSEGDPDPDPAAAAGWGEGASGGRTPRGRDPDPAMAGKR